MMEFVVELVLEVLGDGLIGAVLSIFDSRLPNQTGTRVSRLIGYLVVGAVLGWLSTLVRPTPTLSSPALRVAWLLVAPLIGGTSMSVVKAALTGGAPWLRPWSVAYGAALVGTVNLWRFVALG
jgi:hypothetical protein